MIIAIDGPSGTGKSTVAKGVAGRLGFSFFDTGAMYRSVAWKVLKEGIDPLDREKVISLMSCFQFKIRTDEKKGRRYFVDGEEVTKAIREPHVSRVASQVATYKEVRRALVPIQRAFGKQRDAVFEGRDMGTVIFPGADLKIFLTATAEVRAKRRYQELLTKFPDLAHTLSFDEILKEIEVRDQSDSTREVSPLRRAPDAVLIDTSELSVEQVIDQIIAHLPSRKRYYPRMKLFYRIAYTIAKSFFRLFFRLKVYGQNHFRPGPGILVANHTSLYDPPLLSISCPEEVHFLAKEPLFKVPLFGHLIRALNAHPLKRGASDAHTFRQMIQLLQAGKKLMIFPEGGRSFDGELQPLERGLAFLAQRAKVPIFPAYLQGVFEVWPRTKRFPKLFGKVRCAFGSPIEWEEFAGLEKKEAEKHILKRTEEAILSLKRWLEKGAVGTPP